MVAIAIQVTSGAGLVISIIVLGALLVLWVYCLFVLIFGSISVLAKILWFVLLTCLAPFAIPVYLVWRHHRRSQAAAAG